jgi:uncharacterized protein
VIQYLDNIDNTKSQPSQEILDILAARGYITTKTEEEEIEYVRRFADLLHRKDKILYKGFLFLVAYDCNFKCPYYYESTVLKNSRQWSKKAFTKEMVDKAYEAMMKIEPNEKLRSGSITLYRGEPLLAQNLFTEKRKALHRDLRSCFYQGLRILFRRRTVCCIRQT